MSCKPLILAAFMVPMGVANTTAAQSDTDNEKDSGQRVRIIEPDSEVSRVQAAAIDTEKFQLGVYLGSLSVEDFGSEVVSGLELTYHLYDRWILQANYGTAKIGRAAFETPQVQFLASADRDFNYFNIGGGYQWIHGRSFLGARGKYDSDIYVLAGAERVSFAGNDKWGLNFGLSYRVVLTDWMTLNVDFREHTFKRDFIGDSKQTLNTEFRVGLNGLF